MDPHARTIARSILILAAAAVVIGSLAVVANLHDGPGCPAGTHLAPAGDRSCIADPPGDAAASFEPGARGREVLGVTIGGIVAALLLVTAAAVVGPRAPRAPRAPEEATHGPDQGAAAA